jgi:transposase-like protein
MIKEIHYPYPVNSFRKEEVKLAVLRDYFESNLSVDEVVSRYHLNSKQQFYQWVGQYVGKSLSLPEPKDTDLDMKKQRDSLVALSDQEKDLRIRSLEKALELEKLRSRGFEVMIDVAENELNIPIRKKAGTKQ